MVTKREKCLITAVVVAILMIPLMCILVKNFSGTLPENVCLTKECLKAAVQILENLDTTVDPCDDFYQFACGNYIKNQLLSEDQTEIDGFFTATDHVVSKIRKILEEPIHSNELGFAKMIKKYYKTCLNQTKDNTKLALSLFEEVGGWPLLKGDNWLGDDFEWYTVDSKLARKGMITSSLLYVEVDLLLTNSSQRILQINEPTITIKDFLKSGTDHKIVKAYNDFIIKVGIMLGADPEVAKRDAEDILGFGRNISEISLPLEEKRKSEGTVNIMTVGELAAAHPEVPWITYLNDQVFDTVTITNNTAINVAFPKHLKNLLSLLSRTKKRVLANYLTWAALHIILPRINRKFAEKYEAFYQVIKGTSKPEPLWRKCTDYAWGSFNWAISALYVRRYFSNKAKIEVEEMVVNIRNQFKTKLKEVDWLDANSKKLALEKADAMISFVGYPEEILNDKTIEEFYDLTIDQENFLISNLEINIFSTKKDFSKLNEINDKTDWRSQQSPLEVNAFYEPTSNSIQLSVGILQDDFFQENRPKYINYGGIGYIIGHEITHGFDDDGSEYDKNGNLLKWWSAESREAFQKKAQCIVEQYNNLTVPEVNMTVNGAACQGENIADNGGAKAAYLSYKQWASQNPSEPYLPGLKNYSNLQMFWIAAATPWCTKIRDESLRYQILADEHAPNTFRINVPLANSEYFANEFKCELGTRMNPRSKCAVW